MSDSVYKVIEIVGTSSKSWEAAAATAVERASQSLRDLRIAEVLEQDVQIKDGKIELYRTKLKLAFALLTKTRACSAPGFEHEQVGNCFVPVLILEILVGRLV